MASTGARIVVAFDPYLPDRAALRLAIQLGAGEPQSLHALYVEETDALTLGSFPWAREIATATAEARPLHVEAIERDFSIRAATARSLFEATAAGVADARFERVRGRLEDELKRVAGGAVSVLMDWPSARRRSRHRAATIVHALLGLPASLVGLVEPRGVASSVVVVVTAAGEPAALHALAERLATQAHARITVLRGRKSASEVMESARAASAGTVLLQRGAGDEAMLAELALEWPGSLLLLRE